MNEYLNAGVLLMALGWVGYQLSSVFRTLWGYVKIQFVTTVSLDDDHASLWWVDKYLGIILKDRKKYALRMTSLNDENLLIPGFGVHWFFYKKRLFLVNRSRSYPENGGQRDSAVIYAFVRNQSIINDFLEDSKQAYKQRTDSINVYHNAGMGWRIAKKNVRPLDSIILPNNITKNIIDEITKFTDSKDKYVKRGIPYKLTILLEGIPGSGKTSLVHAVASYLNKDIYAFSTSIEYGSPFDCWDNISDGSILLWEDFDVVMSQLDVKENDKDTTKKTAFKTAALQYLDGLNASDNRILFLTANHPELINPILLRPGRIDLRIKFEPLVKQQIHDFLDRFYEQKLDWEKISDNILLNNWPLSKLQEECQSINDPKEFIEKFSKKQLKNKIHKQFLEV